jgi:hypothetical protein
MTACVLEKCVSIKKIVPIVPIKKRDKGIPYKNDALIYLTGYLCLDGPAINCW